MLLRASTQRLQIYQQLQVPEVWRCTAHSLEIKQLQSGKYISCQHSIAFPMVAAALIQEWLAQGKEKDDDNAIIRALRSWIRSQ